MSAQRDSLVDKIRARPIDDHPYHNKTDAELIYILRDAREAAHHMRGVSAEAECKYLDQINDACTVLHYRRQRGVTCAL